MALSALRCRVEGSCPAVQHRSGRTGDAGAWAPFPACAAADAGGVYPLCQSRSPPRHMPAVQTAAPCARCALRMTERRRTVALAQTPTLTCFYNARRVSASFYGFPPLGRSGVTPDWLVSPCTGAREEFICAKKKEMRFSFADCIFSSFVLQPSWITVINHTR